MAANIINRKPSGSCQLQYPNGDKILVCQPRGTVKIIKVVLGGFFPGFQIHQWPGLDKTEQALKLDFSNSEDPLDAIVKCLSRCNSIAEVKQVCVG